MTKAEKVLKGKLEFKKEMDARLSREDSEKAWEDAHRRLAKMYLEHEGLSKGVSSHTDGFIFPAAAIIFPLRKLHRIKHMKSCAMSCGHVQKK